VATQDPFAKYGGTSLDQEPKPESEGPEDPFAKFGGMAVQQAPEPEAPAQDPFAKFGGQALAPEAPGDAARGRTTLHQIGAGLARGLKEATLPFAVTKEEMEAPMTGAEVAANVASNIGVGLGVTALGGALAGPPGALAAGTLYGIYAGIGNEMMRSKANGESFSFGRAAAQTALEINTVLKSASKAVRAIRAAAQVGGAYALERSYGTEDPLTLATATALQGAAPVLLTKGFRADRAFAPPQAAAEAAKALALDEPAGLATRVTQKFGKLSKSELTPDEANPEFRRWLTGASEGTRSADVDQSFDELWLRHGDKAKQDAWARWKLDRVLVGEAEDMARSQYNTLTGRSMAEPTSAVGRLLKDMQLVANDVDEKLGTNFVGAIDGFSRSKDAFTVAAANAYKVGVQARRASQKLRGVSEESIGKALAGEWGKIPGAEAKILQSDQGKAVLAKWQESFDSVFKQVQAAGYEPGRLQNYFPLQSLRGADLGVAVERGVEQLQARAFAQGIQDFRELAKGDKDAQEFLSFIASRLNKPLDELSNKEVLQASRQLITQEVKTGTGYSPTALHLRTGDLPESLREWRPGEMLTFYINNNLKGVYMQDAFSSMTSHIKALDTIGLTKTADYYRRYLNDMSGISRGTQLILQDNAERLRFWARKLETQGGAKGAVGRAAAAVPDFMAAAQSAIYPAYLGFNLRASLRNLTQTWMTTAPEIGGAYGYGLVARGMTGAAKDITTGVNPADFLRSRGQLSGAIGHEQAQVLDPGRMSGRLREAYNNYNEIAMAAYSATDTANRFITMKTAAAWAEDLVKGDPRAIKALSNLQRGARERLRPEIEELLRTKNAARLGDVLGDYLVSRTQFRYGKEQLNEFGRIAGPMVSMFSKWPVMVTSDIINQVRHRGARDGSLRLMEKYIAPYMALYGTASYLKERTEVAEHPTYKYLLGDITSLSPLEAAFSWDLAGGPLVRAPAAIGQAIKEPLGAGGVALRETIKAAPLVGPVLNEVDRVYRAQGQTSYTTQLLRSLKMRAQDALGGPLPVAPAILPPPAPTLGPEDDTED